MVAVPTIRGALLLGVALFAATTVRAQPAPEADVAAPTPAEAVDATPAEATPAASATPATVPATAETAEATPAEATPAASTTPETTPATAGAVDVTPVEPTPEETRIATPTATPRKRISRATPTPTPTPTLMLTTSASPSALEPVPELVLVEDTSSGAVATITSALGTALARPLPPVTPEPAIAPVIEGTQGKREVIAAARRPEAVVWTILGLLAVAALAWVAGDRRLLRFEETLGISQVITTGFPFVLLGMIARSRHVGIVSDDVLGELSPILRLGLGWIGLIVGFRFDAHLLGGLPRGTARVVAFATSLPFGLVLATTGLLLFVTTGLNEESLRDPVFVRDALILGTAAAMTAVTATRAAGPAADTVERLVRIEELAGIVGLALVAAYFRPHAGVSWQLPGTAWLFLTVGLGATLGVLVYGILLRAANDAEFIALTLGSVSLVAGIAGYLHLSSVVVAFLVGAMLANIPGSPKAKLGVALFRLERPIYLVSLFVIGALWDVTDWRGWVLVPVFAGARLAGKWLAIRFGLPGSGLLLPSEAKSALVFSPIGPLAIAIVVNAELLYPGGSISRIVSGVIGGAVITEIVVQYRNRKSRENLAQMLPAPDHLSDTRSATGGGA